VYCSVRQSESKKLPAGMSAVGWTCVSCATYDDNTVSDASSDVSVAIL
jgi:hypothetical protein